MPARPPRARRLALTLASLALLGAGALLARTLEPHVRVEAATLLTPSGRRIAALRFRPEPAPAHPAPTALLAHGVTTSKETNLVLGEALAAAGFEAVAVDFPGHGASPGPFGAWEDLVSALEAGARALVPGAPAGSRVSLDVVAGHSLGAAVLSRALEARGPLAARLFVASGARPLPPEAAERVLYLLGSHDELLAREEVELAAGHAPERTRVVVSWRSDHALEPWDPALVRAAVEGACQAVGRPLPPPATAWRTRLVGVILVGLGALGAIAWGPPRARSRALAALVGAAAGALSVAALVLGVGTAWLGASLDPGRLPRQGALALGAALASAVAGAAVGRVQLLARARATWGQLGLALLAGLVAAASSLSGESFGALVLALFALLLAAGAGVGALVARRTASQASAHAAFAVVLGYALGQWIPA